VYLDPDIIEGSQATEGDARLSTLSKAMGNSFVY
jgi:hypothetical protein